MVRQEDAVLVLFRMREVVLLLIDPLWRFIVGIS